MTGLHVVQKSRFEVRTTAGYEDIIRIYTGTVSLLCQVLTSVDTQQQEGRDVFTTPCIVLFEKFSTFLLVFVNILRQSETNPV